MSIINEKKDTRTNEITICHNCGSTGHIYNECKLAIISIGIILYRKNKQTDKIEYLMIRRNESFGFSDFFYGKIINYNLSILENVIDEMTIKEKKLIQDYINDIDIDISENQKKRINSINTLCCNSNIINLDKTISNSFTKWEEPEWGFPKGRRNNNEKELDCALREFEEETGIKKNKISLIENVIPYEEIFIASNYKTYKHKYFIAEIDDDALYSLDNYQKTEVSKINWFTIDECIKIIRPYNSEKTNMLNNINNLLLFNTIV
tara:strand:- start:92 stop:883 length:792 start_codon:yes stop_codon:yes gene_type:complete